MFSRRILIAGLMCAAGCGDNLAPVENSAELSTSPIAVLVGDGSPCFAADAALGDFNGDGLADIAVLDDLCQPDPRFGVMSTELRLSVFYRTASGFDPAATTSLLQGIETSAFGSKLIVGDFDGNGTSDIIVVQTIGDDIAVSGTADGLADVRTVNVGSFPVVVDINGDGRDEVVVGPIQGLGVYEIGATERLIERAQGISLFRFSDVNGDGKRDFLVVNENETFIRVACEVVEGCLSGQDGENEVWRDGRVIGTFSDVSGDGVEDILVRDEWDEFHVFAGGLGRVGESVWSAYPAPDDAGFRDVTAIDLNGNGKRELILWSYRGAFLFEAGDQGFALAPAFFWPAETGVRAILEIPDLNGDGLPEMALAAASFDAELQQSEIRIYGGGTSPSEAPAVEFGAELTCEASASLPDLAVDVGFLRRSAAIRYAEFDGASCELEHACVGAAGRRKLLDFSVAVQNLGGAEVLVPGPAVRPDLWEFDSCHGHDHLRDFARYELLDSAGAQVVVGRKQGYYLYDSYAYCRDVPPQRTFDGDLHISPGWADIYYAGIPCQWLDITDLPDGDYLLRVDIDLADLVAETDTRPNRAEANISIRGDTVAVE